MDQHDAFEQFVASLNEAMLDDSHWLAASALIDEACGSMGNQLVFGTEPRGSNGKAGARDLRGCLAHRRDRLRSARSAPRRNGDPHRAANPDL